MEKAADLRRLWGRRLHTHARTKAIAGEETYKGVSHIELSREHPLAAEQEGITDTRGREKRDRTRSPDSRVSEKSGKNQRQRVGG